MPTPTDEAESLVSEWEATHDMASHDDELPNDGRLTIDERHDLVTRIAHALAARRVSGWVATGAAKDGALHVVVYLDNPIVDYDLLIFANGEWWHPETGSTCDDPDLVLELPPLPPAPEDSR